MQHGANVLAATFSPDGQRIVTVSGDRTARLWSAVTGEPLGTPMQNGAATLAATFSPDGLRIVTASGDRTARTVGRGDRCAARPADAARRPCCDGFV